MHRMMYKIDIPHLYIRDGVYYFVRRIPVDIRSYYSSKRISMSLKTKSLATANRAVKSINQRLINTNWQASCIIKRHEKLRIKFALF